MPLRYTRRNATTREQYARRSLSASREWWKPGEESAELTRRAARPNDETSSGQAGMASDSNADEWTDRGVVAQLGEHLHGMQGVGGSSPPSSTNIGQRHGGTAKHPFVLTTEGCCGIRDGTQMATREIARRATRDGRPFTLRHARPTDARALARLFAAVRSEGRYFITPPSARSDPQESFYIGHLIRSGGNLVLVAEADGGVVGNVMITHERSGVQDHLGVLSICVDREWRDGGMGTALVAAALEWSRGEGLLKVTLSVFPDNERAIAVYERAGFVREGHRRAQFRAPGGGFRDELLMAWFAPEADR